MLPLLSVMLFRKDPKTLHYTFGNLVQLSLLIIAISPLVLMGLGIGGIIFAMVSIFTHILSTAILMGIIYLLLKCFKREQYTLVFIMLFKMIALVSILLFYLIFIVALLFQMFQPPIDPMVSGCIADDPWLPNWLSTLSPYLIEIAVAWVIAVGIYAAYKICASSKDEK